LEKHQVFGKQKQREMCSLKREERNELDEVVQETSVMKRM